MPSPGRDHSARMSPISLHSGGPDSALSAASALSAVAALYAVSALPCPPPPPRSCRVRVKRRERSPCPSESCRAPRGPSLRVRVVARVSGPFLGRDRESISLLSRRGQECYLAPCSSGASSGMKPGARGHSHALPRLPAGIAMAWTWSSTRLWLERPRTPSLLPPLFRSTRLFQGRPLSCLSPCLLDGSTIRDPLCLGVSAKVAAVSGNLSLGKVAAFGRRRAVGARARPYSITGSGRASEPPQPCRSGLPCG